jgi:Flp pilus assembly protein TadB
MSSEPGLIRESFRVVADLIAGEEAEAAADYVEETYPDAEIHRFPAYISIERERELRFDVEDLQERLGRSYDIPTFLVIFASYIGRVSVDDRWVTLKSEIESR